MICEECEREVDSVATEGRFTGVCERCETDLRLEDRCFTRDHIEVFGEDDHG